MRMPRHFFSPRILPANENRDASPIFRWNKPPCRWDCHTSRVKTVIEPMAFRVFKLARMEPVRLKNEAQPVSGRMMNRFSECERRRTRSRHAKSFPQPFTERRDGAIFHPSAHPGGELPMKTTETIAKRFSLSRRAAVRFQQSAQPLMATDFAEGKHVALR